MLNPLRTASRKACGWCDAKPTIRRLWQWVIFCRFAHLDFGRTFFSCGHDQPIPCVPSTRVCRLPQLGCSVDRAANSPIAGDVACWPIASTHRSMVVGLPRKPTRLRNCAPSIASSDRCPVSEVLRSLPSSSLDAGFIMAARSGSLLCGRSARRRFIPIAAVDRSGVARLAWAISSVRFRRPTGRIFHPTNSRV